MKLVIFDCDGVLVDSERIAVRVSAAGLTDLGWPMTEADVLDRFVGRSDDFIRGEVAGRLGADVADAWQVEFQRRYRQASAGGLKPVDGVIEALDAITTPTCVASSGTHEKIRYSLGLVGLLDRFDGRIFSVSDVERPKPAPDLFLHAATSLGVAPPECAVVEDSPAGVEAARAAGMRTFAYAGGLTPADRLAGAHTAVFADMRELPRLLRTER
ncbi:MAG: HAD family hydrolase [Candidatus Limnocylindria bacterium]